MALYTSRYSYWGLKHFEGAIIPISRSLPKFAVEYDMKETIKELAPAYKLMKIQDRQEFTAAYIKQLEALGYERIKRLINDRARGNSDAVLLCFEDVYKPGLYCHRTILADWLNQYAENKVYEIERPPVAEEATVTNQTTEPEKPKGEQIGFMVPNVAL